MTSPALERLALFFGPEPTRQGLLARASLGQPGPGDPELVGALLDRLRAEIRADGSVGGAIVATAWRAHELMDLAVGSKAGVEPLIRWLLALQGRVGAFGKGCDRPRHARRVCEHFVIGFFAAAPPEQRLTPITLPNGKVFRAEPAARFAISCLALRAALRAGHQARPMIQQHLQSLVRLADQWTEWNGYFAPDVILSGLHALAVAGPDYREVVGRLVDLVAASQAPDGSWSNADLFHALEALLAADTPAAQESVRRAVPALLSRQRVDGTFGATAQQERAMIGLMALLWVDRGLLSPARGPAILLRPPFR
jgi:hypothetical protein